MATYYSSWLKRENVNVCRAVIEVTVTSNTATAATIQIVTKLQYGNLIAWPTELASSLSIATSIGSSAASTTATVSYVRGGTQTLNTRSVTITKTHAAQSVAVSGTVTLTYRGSSQHVALAASGTQSVSAKTSYAVRYYANGGDANTVPSAQTKWHNEDITLSATVPKRVGCSFLGWNTKADGTGTHYAAGSSYAGNAALPLYAVWLGVSVPTIDVKRTDSGGAEADEGTYGTVAATWQAVGTPAASIAVTARNVTAESTIALSGNTSGSKAVNKSASGSVSAIFGGSLSSDVRYQVTVTVTVTATYNGATHTVTATSTAYVAYAYITLEAHKGGHGLAVGVAAHREGFDVQMTPFYSAEPIQHNGDVNTTTIANVIEANASVATVTSVEMCKWGRMCMVTVNWKNESDISVPASGNITNLVIGTLVEGVRPAITTDGESHGDNAGQARYYINKSGTVQLGSVEGTGAARTIAAGSTFNMHAQFLLP